MCAAHNRIARTNGYSPAQWAFRQDLKEPDGLATWSAAADPASTMHKNIQRRLDAEATYRKLQAHAEISRAVNARPDLSTQYIPGETSSTTRGTSFLETKVPTKSSIW